MKRSGPDRDSGGAAMNPRQRAELFRIAGGRVEWDAPMSRRTTFRVGGQAEALCEVQEMEELSRLLTFLKTEGIPRLVIGRGSNLLVRDSGIRGVVIRLSGALGRIDWGPAGSLDVVAGAGASIADLLIGCRQRGLSGLEFLAGIPGTVGGAVVMNAGAFGHETGTWVKEVRIVTPGGNVRIVERSQLAFSYRRLDLAPGDVIALASFRLKRDAEKGVAQHIARNLKRRKASQPLEYPSAGSVFKNPPNDHAGRLIEKAGLKGRSVGGAMISERHANFIVNKGGATASDVLALIDLVRDAVYQTAGVTLELEVRVVGEPPGQDGP